MSFPVPVRSGLLRWLPVPALALALGTPLTAQIISKPPKGGTNIAVVLPAATKGGLTSKTGMPWSQFRKNGISLAVEGQAGMDVVVHVIRLKAGKVVDRWSSPSTSMTRSGTMSLAGDKFLPGTSLRPGTVTQPGKGTGVTEKNVGLRGPDITPANPWIPVADAQRAVTTGDMSPFIQPGKMGEATGLIIVAVPNCQGSGCLSVRTQAALAMPCMFADQ